jgi:hypothetical protein
MAEEKKEEKKEEDRAQDTPSLKVKVGDQEKILTASDVGEIISRQSGIQKKIDELSDVQKVLDKYGVDAPTYLQHAEGAIAITAKMIEDGIIDARGNFVKKSEERKITEKKKDLDLFGEREKEEESSTGDRVTNIVGRALQTLEGRLAKIEENQGRLVENDMRSRLSKQFPDLDETDLDSVFDIAFKDRKMSLSQHAKDYAGRKTVRLGDLRKKHAAEFGIDLTEWEKKKQSERERKESGATDLAFLVKGKKLTFEPGDDKDAVTPIRAMQEFFKKHGGS